MFRDPFDGLSGDEMDPQAAETDQLATLGMHEVVEEEEDDDPADEEQGADEEEEKKAASDDLDKDGLEELEEMEQELLKEDPILDFAMIEEE